MVIRWKNVRQILWVNWTVSTWPDNTKIIYSKKKQRKKKNLLPEAVV